MFISTRQQDPDEEYTGSLPLLDVINDPFNMFTRKRIPCQQQQGSIYGYGPGSTIRFIVNSAKCTARIPYVWRVVNYEYRALRMCGVL